MLDRAPTRAPLRTLAAFLCHLTPDHLTLDHLTLDHLTLDHLTLDHLTLERAAPMAAQPPTLARTSAVQPQKCALGSP